MVGSEKNTFPAFVESLLKIDDEEESKESFAQIPCVNTCLTSDALLEYDSRLVRFDCQITDMFEEQNYQFFFAC